VEAAVEMIDEGTDPAQVSIRAVTRRAGVSPTAFYLHFANHDELLAAMVDRSFTEFRDSVRAGAAKGTDAAGRLNEAGMAYTAFANRWPARYALNFVYVRPAEGEPPTKPTAADDAFNDLVTLVLDYLGPDSPRREEAELLARGIWSGMHGYVSLRQARTGKGWPDEAEFVPRLSLTWLGEPAR
jgi:AcrR family transcriptional regulator